MLTRPSPRATVKVAAAAAFCALAAAPPAHAGRLVVSGYDADHHCGRTFERQVAQLCATAKLGVDYVRAGAPDPNKPVLVVDHTRGQPFEFNRPTRTFGPNLRNPDWVNTLNRIYGPNGVPYVVVDPQSEAFQNASLTTANYSAILVASSRSDGNPNDPYAQDLDTSNSAPDSVAISRRKDDIANFFDQGGGIYAGSAGNAARRSPGYYSYLPISSPGAIYKAPFTPTALGASFGLSEPEVNGQYPHIAFELPAADAPLKPLVVDSGGNPLSLIAEASRLASIREPVGGAGGAGAAEIGAGLPGSTGGSGGTGRPSARCRKSSKLRIVLRRPRGVAFVRAEVFINGRRVKTVSRKRLGRGRKTKAFNVRLKRTRKNNVRIQVRTSSGKRVTIKRSYTVCR